jgi:hypothetical protein
MPALVVYESLWGNTEAIARAIGAELQKAMEVVVLDTDSAPRTVDGFDLVVVGGPTHAFSMTRTATREDAVTANHAPHLPGRGIREWFSDLQSASAGTKGASFDTRVDSPRLPGSAAKAAKHELRSLGFDIIVKPKSFRVHGNEGPLVDGELERAAEWARELIESASARAAARSV